MQIAESQLSPADWDARAAAAGSPLQQMRAYGAAAAALGATVRRFVIRAEYGDVALAQVLTRRVGPARLSVLNRGPVWTGPAQPAAIRRAALRALACRIGPFIATPGEDLRGWGLFPLVTPRTEAAVDLSPEPAALRAALIPQWRNKLPRCAAAGLRVSLRRASFDDLAPLIAADAAQRHLKGYRALPPAFLRAWLGAAPGGALLAVARGSDGLAAAMLFLIHGSAATYQIAWSGPEGRAAHAHNALLWAAMLGLRGRGVTALNLGDIATDTAPDLARFKLGTGARPVTLGATCLVLPPIPPRSGSPAPSARIPRRAGGT